MEIADLTVAEQQTLRQAAHCALARQNFMAHCTYIDPKYTTPKHVLELGRHLQAVEEGTIKRLIITMPPRHSKSETANGKFPSWCLGRDPSRTFITVSHSALLAETFSVQNRDTIRDNPRYHEVFPEITINPNRRSAQIWGVNNYRENVLASGIQGGITGFGAWLLLIDDPIKTYEQSVSRTYRDKVYQEYKTAARTRLGPDGRIIVIMTRWHEDDLVGRILASEEGSEWTVLHFPALSYGSIEDYAEDGQLPNPLTLLRDQHFPASAFPDPLGRPKGEALWPERFSREFLEVTRRVLQDQFEALYQGNPGAPTGNKFKRFWFRSITQDRLNEIGAKKIFQARSYDLAWSTKQDADETIGLRASIYKVPESKVGIKQMEAGDGTKFAEDIPPLIIVLEDMARWRKEWDQASPKIIDLAKDDGAAYKVLMEAVASQNQGVKSLRGDLRMAKHAIIPVVPDKDKIIRAKFPMRVASLGCVYILYPNASTPPDWETGFLDQMATFPFGMHDDIVDAFTQFVNYREAVITQHLINKMTEGVTWTTPFMKNKLPPKGFIKELPQPFRGARKTRKKWRRGWKVNA